MNILVLGSVRTKSAALTQYLNKQYPECENWGEPLYNITIQSSNPLVKNKQKFIDTKLNELFDEMFQTNCLLKMLGSNLFGLSNYINNLNLHKFNQIHTIERNDFFDQVCSITVARQEKLFHKTQDNLILYKQVEKKQFEITKTTVLQTAQDVFHYMLVKRHLAENNINFFQHSYDSLQNITNLFVMPNNLNYNNLIKNYHLKEHINSMFLENFNYKNISANIEDFTKKLEILPF
jgi:hypothetical protein